MYIADPAFPFLVRKSINGAAKLFKVAGKFFTVQEIADDFSRYGFELDRSTRDGIAQVVKLRKVSA